MNKRQRQEVSKAFQKAKCDLWGGISHISEWEIGMTQEKYICDILWRNMTTFKLSEINFQAIKIITERLEGHGRLEDWLVDNGIPRFYLTEENVQAHRLEWLNRLVKEFSDE